MVKASISGGCACGSIRYELKGEMGFSFHCQCRDCQRLSGTGHTSVFLSDQRETSVEGDLSWFEREAPSKNVVSSGFCGTCGSSVLSRNSGYPNKYFITAASLDDPTLFCPTKVIYQNEAAPWDNISIE